MSQLFNNEKKLFLAQTNPAIDNLKRRVDADHCTFSTITSFLKREMFSTDYHLLVIDESSTVNNNDMVKILNKANFNIILLVGDTYQINSIRFGNWFTVLRHFIPETSVFELTQPYRAKNNQRLLNLWSKVREMSDDVKEYVEKQRHSLKVDHRLFVKSDEDEVTLCLNYDGLYGINNINRFLQESNPNPTFTWGIQQYKVGDKFLAAMNEILAVKDEIIENCLMLGEVFFHDEQLQEKIDRIKLEKEAVSKKIRQLIQRHSVKPMKAEEYYKQCDILNSEYEALEAKEAPLLRKKEDMLVKRKFIQDYVEMLRMQDCFITEFSEELSLKAVDHATVCVSGEMIFCFKDGTETKV
ncbi:MAG: AAA family ATPase [Ruminococcus flavefaciens]|nr:AAA family ATPase [Ruminococcus flavefaciens]